MRKTRLLDNEYKTIIGANKTCKSAKKSQLLDRIPTSRYDNSCNVTHVSMIHMLARACLALCSLICGRRKDHSNKILTFQQPTIFEAAKTLKNLEQRILLLSGQLIFN